MGRTLRFLLVLMMAPSFSAAQALIRCDVTVPNLASATAEVEPGFYGSRELSAGLWPDGTVVFKPRGPGSVLPDGALQMKFAWRRGVQGELSIAGRRLDGPATPLRANIPSGYGPIGFQSTGLIFPTPGCWEVTGRVGNASLTFVTRVIKIGEGPAGAEASPDASLIKSTALITVFGSGLQGPLEIAEPSVLSLSNVYAGYFIAATADEPDPALPRYTVVFDIQLRGGGQKSAAYVVHYSANRSTGEGFIYLPGRGDDSYIRNISTILRTGQDGRWHHASPAWSEAISAHLNR